MVQGQGVVHFGAGEAEALVPSLRLVPGVGEQQSADPGVQAGHQLFVHAQAEMSRPGEAVDAVGKNAVDLRDPNRGSTDDQRFALRSEGMAAGLFKVADRGADRPGLKTGPVLS